VYSSRSLTSSTDHCTYRVALARAVYGRFDSLVLDDPFSALDADTESRVFQALFGNNNLLKGKTVILASNQLYRLSYASYMTLLHEGRAVEQGNYAELMAEDGMMS